MGLNIADGKVVPKEISEDERAALEEANKAKGKPGAKDAKKGGAKEEEPSAEELEKMEKERLEREEREKKLQEEWATLDEETKHIRHNEDIFKEPCIKMQNTVMMEKIEKLQAQMNELPEEEEEGRSKIQAEIDELAGSTNIGMAKCVKTGYELIEIEESVLNDKGTWIRFKKILPTIPEGDV